MSTLYHGVKLGICIPGGAAPLWEDVGFAEPGAVRLLEEAAAESKAGGDCVVAVGLDVALVGKEMVSLPTIRPSEPTRIGTPLIVVPDPPDVRVAPFTVTTPLLPMVNT